MNAAAAVVEAVRDVVDAALVRPVREGRPHPRAWPQGLGAVAVVTAVLYLLVAAAAAAAHWLRRVDELAVSPVTGITLPNVAIPILLAGLVWSMVLLHVAALHTTWWPRLALVLASVVAVAMFSSRAWGTGALLVASVVAYVLLGVFTLVRSRRGYAWWEFPVVGIWMVVVLFLPWLGSGFSDLFGMDYRLTALQGTIETLQVLSVPALLAAGVAPAIITVTAGESLASRPFPRWLAVVLVLGLVGWRVGDLAWSVRQSATVIAVPSLVAAALTLLILMGLAAILRRRSTRATMPGLGALPELWAAYVWPLAMSIGWMILVTVPLSIGQFFVAATPFGARVIEPLWRWYLMYGPQTLRVGVGLVAFVVAWRLAARQQVLGAVLLTAFFVYALVQRVGPLTGVAIVGGLTPEAFAAVSSAVAVVLLAAFLATRRLTRRRAVALVTVLLLGGIYPHRNSLDDPISAVLGFAGLFVLLFGLVWQALTNGDYTDGDSRTFPKSTRVLLYLANALFAVTGAAFLSLARETTSVSATDWTELGDDLLGTPLFVAALVVSFWLAVGPQPRDEDAGS